MKLSVIVPMYNVRDYCATALKSLALNARSDFEFIVIDDCSTDGTFEILQREIRKVPGGVLHQNPQNSGISYTRNAGLGSAQGKYIAFLDGDDWFAPGYLSHLVAAIERFGCDFVRTDHVRVVGRKREIVRSPQAVRNTLLEPIRSIMPVDASTMIDYPLVWAGIFDRELLERRGLLFFDEKLRTAEDRMWTWRLHLYTHSYVAVDLAGVFYRRDVSTSLTRIPDERQLDFIPCFEQVTREVSEHPWGAQIMPKAIRTFCAMMAIHLDRADTYEPDVKALLKSRVSQALDALPQDLLERTFEEMGERRAKLINSVRGSARVTSASHAQAHVPPQQGSGYPQQVPSPGQPRSRQAGAPPAQGSPLDRPAPGENRYQVGAPV